MDQAYGAIWSKYDVRDYTLSEVLTSLPDKFILPDIPIKNQRPEPTCTPHVISEIIEYHYLKNTGKFLRFSTDYIYGLREERYKEEGMSIRDGLNVARHLGDIPHSMLPTNSKAKRAKQLVNNRKELYLKAGKENCINSYYKINTVDELKTAIYKDGPVAAAMRWQTQPARESKYYSFDKTKEFTGHAILIIGWTKEYFIRQNSWGRFWGEQGKFYIPISLFSDVFYDIYGVTDDDANLIKPNNFINFFAFIINLFRKGGGSNG